MNILRKNNGKLVGCCFIQYNKVPEAAKVIKELNMKPFLGNFGSFSRCRSDTTERTDCM